MKKPIFFAVVISIIAMCTVISCGDDNPINAIKKAVPDKEPPIELVGKWSTTSSEMLALQFFMNDGEISSTDLNLTWDSKYTLTSVEGTFGLGTKVTSKGTYRVFSALQMIELIDEFDDVYLRNKYVVSATEDENGMITERVLKLKGEGDSITTFYAGPVPQ